MDRLSSLFSSRSGSGEAGRRWGFGSQRIGEAGHQQVTFISDRDGIEIVNFQSRTSIVLGILQIGIGVFYMTVNSISINYTSNSDSGQGLIFDISGHGIWCGTMFIITGSFGVWAGKLKTKCKVVTFMILCIISAVITIIGFAFGVVELLVETMSCYIRDPVSMHEVQGDCSHDQIISSFYVCLTVCEAISAIAGSAICCRVVCCGASRRLTGHLVISRSNIPDEGIDQTTQRRTPQAPPYEDAAPVDMPAGSSREHLLPPPYSPEDPYSRRARETTEKSILTTMNS